MQKSKINTAHNNQPSRKHWWILPLAIVLAYSCTNKGIQPTDNEKFISLENEMVEVKLLSTNDTINIAEKIKAAIKAPMGWTPIDQILEPDYKKNKHLVIRHKVDLSRWNHPAIAFSGKDLQIAIYEDTCCIFSNVNYKKQPSGFTSKMINLKGDKEITIHYYFYYENFLETPYLTFTRVGEGNELLDDVIVIDSTKELGLSELFMGIIIITIGIISLISALFYNGRNRKMLLFFALFAISSGISSLEMGFIQLMDISRSTVTIIMFSTSLLPPLGFIGFLQYGIESPHTKFLRIAFWFTVIWIILFIALLIVFPITITYWSGMIIILLLVGITIVKEKIYRKKEFRLPMLGLTILMGCLIQNALNNFNIMSFSINADYGILVLVFSLVIYVVKDIRKSNLQIQLVKTELEQSQNRLLTLENQNIQSQFDALRGQINPHFLFNSLNTLASLINIDTNRATRFVEEFSNVYRRLLDVKGDILITVDDEMTFLKSYIYLQEIRFGQNLQFHIDIANDLLDRLLPPLSIQLLVENALKHNEISEDFPLRVTIKADNNFIYVINPINPKSGSMAKPSGIGLENLRKRYSQITEIAPSFTSTGNEYIAKIPLLNDN